MEIIKTFSGLTVDSLTAAKQFYTATLGLTLQDDRMGLSFALPGGGQLFIYEKADHQPASYTALNLVVADINAAVDELVGKGVLFERYDDMPGAQDKRGIMRGKAVNRGPDIAWFKDPAGNILSIIEE